MSHTALRRVAIRMLHDPAFAAAVYDDPERALVDVELTARERAWLAAAPPAAWRTDPDRPARVLAALRDEFPAAAPLAPAHVEAFFRSAAFHHAVQHRGSLALALSTHLQECGDPRVVHLAKLEGAVARVRRAPRAATPTGGDRLRLTPRAVVVRTVAGALALLQARRRGEPGGPLGDATEHVLVVRAVAGDDVSLEEASPGLVALLEAAVVPIAREKLHAVARGLGAEPGEEAEIVAALTVDGLLI